MKYEWMIEIPEDLGPAWRVIARPEGRRCLLIASGCECYGHQFRNHVARRLDFFRTTHPSPTCVCRGRTVSRLESGKVYHVFPSALPNGSNKTKKPPNIFCMFDAVFHEAEQAYYILDVLAWNGIHLCGSDLDARMNWTRSHFQRSPASAPPFAGHKYQLHMCCVHVCTQAGVLRLMAQVQ
jgi:snurportin-1